ncbi:hypothetical protein MSG28_001792 [Choristoneura fumiferana]|uniref:Uncharacterized protein n=1 Tax=Choristoneura fumiferana TaxID=7141 RepID=A0ACC0KW62_CHOFU|nr:hypothetical protein MSG28_001792 [Choristoneura fumiferana]
MNYNDTNSGEKVRIGSEDLITPNGIAVDWYTDKIYCTVGETTTVEVISIDQKYRKVLFWADVDLPRAIAVVPKEGKIYSWDISTNGPMKDLIKSEPVPVDIRVYDSSRQLPPVGNHPCKVNNGGCSHLCLLSPTAPGYVCSCPTGLKLKDGSNSTCFSTPQSLLLVARRTVLTKISLDSPDFTPYSLPLKDLKRAVTVDFDPKTEYIYWADSLVLIHDDLYNPRAISVHPTAGWMFWSDWNEKKPKIERSNLDGSGRILVVSEKLIWPNGIALDTVNNKLYWGDGRLRKIEVCDMDGSNRVELHNSDILHIFGLTLLGEHLYWSDIHRRTLDRIDVATGGSLAIQ